jgi:hypothetical protein
MKILFKNFYYDEYKKTYDNTKKNKEGVYNKNSCSHIIFTNIKL